MAEAAGLKLLPPTQRDPLRTQTAGVGELIKAALNKKARQIIIGLGGSATVDGATGLAQALGIKFFDARGKPVKPTGGSLIKIKHIDISGLDRRCRKIKIIAACDVTNPLIGPRGAARTFASQKGANAQAAKILERNLAHLGRIIKKDLGVDIVHLKGGGAAGGCGAGLAAFLKARLVSGADLFLEIIDLKKKLENTDLVITGEGTLDRTTLAGKAPASLARAVKKYNKKIPVIALGGKLGPGYRRLASAGIDACFSISPKGMSRKQSIRNAGKLIENYVSVIIKNEFFKNKKIVLASASQRRRELLKKIVPRFKIIKPRLNEEKIIQSVRPPSRLVQTLARVKAGQVSQTKALTRGKYRNAIIIAADTIVWARRKVITKPKNQKDAFRILKKLSGTRQAVITGVCVLDNASGRLVSGVEATIIRMKKISDQEIRRLAGRRRHRDKAGGYAIQEKGDRYLEIVQGRMDNAVGLPLSLTRQLLRQVLRVT
jgi:glycerate kinase